MDFQEAHAYLDSLQFHKIKLGLDSMRSFLERVDRPDKSLKYVHVAGTNGKGSVSATILTLLSRAGYRVGLYTSPHLSSVRERFRINDSYIGEEDFARNATRIRKVLGEEMITYFEFTTALALLWFAESDLDLVILETGLGGRLDATNVITPLVSVITNVSMDHEAYLGNDLQSVAFEKAGIIKAGVPVISGTDDDISREVVKSKCRDEQVPFYQAGEAFTIVREEGRNWSWHGLDDAFHGARYPHLRCAMKGNYQQTNGSLALAVVEILREYDFSVSEDDITNGLMAVRWPGRLEHLVLQRTTRRHVTDGDQLEGNLVHYLIDGAHNPAGVESLVATLKTEYDYDRLIVVWGAMADKDLSQTVPAIADLAAAIILTKPEGERSAEPEQLYRYLENGAQKKAERIANVPDALAVAEEQAGPEDLIVVAGSLYLIGEVRTLLMGELVDQ